jgi:putative transposase
MGPGSASTTPSGSKLAKGRGARRNRARGSWIASPSRPPGKRGERGYDGAKKVNGRKRHLLVEVTGLVLRVVVHAANLADGEGGRLVLDRITEHYPELAHLWVDAGYTDGFVAWARTGLGLSVERVRKGAAWTRVPPGEEPAARSPFPILPRRWVVERTFAWLGRYRRMSRDYEALPQTQEALVHLCMIRLMLRRLAS